MSTTIYREVPPISEWSMYAGGTGAPHDSHGFTCNTPHGSYHLDPFGGRRVQGYSLRFCNTPDTTSGGRWIGPGLWHHLGRVSRAASGAVLARAHHAEITVRPDAHAG